MPRFVRVAVMGEMWWTGVKKTLDGWGMRMLIVIRYLISIAVTYEEERGITQRFVVVFY